jgi:hypothetical protein
LTKENRDELLRGGFTCTDFTPEEHEILCDKLRGLVALRWLKVIRPNLTKENRDELLPGGFTWADFTPEEHEILCSKRGELGMTGSTTSLHKLIDPDLSPAEYEELIATKGAGVLLEELWMKRCISK